MKFGLEPVVLDSFNRVFTAYPQIERVIIYGSRAKGTYRKGSDIDLTLIGKGLNDVMLSQIKNALENLNTPYLVDVSIYGSLNASDLIEHILRVGQVFYQRKELDSQVPSVKEGVK